MSLPNRRLSLEELVFNLERIEARAVFDPRMLERLPQMYMKRFENVVKGTLEFQLSGILAKWIADETLLVPATWWDHFKQRWFPEWAKRRWPVATRAYHAEMLLPKLKLPPDPKGPTVVFPVWREGFGRPRS